MLESELIYPLQTKAENLFTKAAKLKKTLSLELKSADQTNQ